jgi:hypothetical protein
LGRPVKRGHLLAVEISLRSTVSLTGKPAHDLRYDELSTSD